MKKLSVFSSTGACVAKDCSLANTFYSRLIGLLNHSELREGEGLLLQPCNQVHTFFMSFAIDAVFLGQKNEIVGLETLKPWRLSKLYWKAKKVLELPKGMIQQHSLKFGETLELSYV